MAPADPIPADSTLAIYIEHRDRLLTYAARIVRSRASADVKQLAMAHIRDLEAKAAELKAMADTLRHLAAHCHGDHRPDCPILSDFATQPLLAEKA